MRRAAKSGPARDLWIEMFRSRLTSLNSLSGPARDLWIEISAARVKNVLDAVGSRKGPVD